MNKDIIKEQIARSLEMILEQTDTIFGYDGKIPQIELDILLTNMRKLYEQYINLNKFNFDEQEKPSQSIFAPTVNSTTSTHQEAQQPHSYTHLSYKAEEEIKDDKIAINTVVAEEPVVKNEVIAEPVVEAAPVIEQVKAVEPIIVEQPEVKEIVVEKAVIEEPVIAEVSNDIVAESVIVPEPIIEEATPVAVVTEVVVEAKTEDLIEMAVKADIPTQNIETANQIEVKPEVIEVKAEASDLDSLFAEPKKEEPIVEEVAPKKAAAHDYGFSGGLFPAEKIATITEERPATETPKKRRPKSPLDLFGESSQNLADKLKEEKQTLADKLSSSKDNNNLASKMQHQPIDDLKKGIGINEKFLFINELFDGSMNDYNQALSHINNNCTNLDEARKFILFLQDNFNWDMSRTSVAQFKAIVERRFVN